MFHVLLVLPVLAAFGAVAAVVLGIMGIFLAAGFLLQLLLTLFCAAVKWLLWLPALLGLVGLVLCLLAPLPVSAGVVLAFWGFYALVLLCGLGIARLLGWLFRGLRRR